MLTDTQIKDLVNSTLAKFDKDKFEQIAQELQEYYFMKELMTNRGGVIVKDGGVGIEETLMTGFGGRSRWVGMYAQDEVVVGDFLTKARLDWKHLTDNVAYDRGELERNSGASRVLNVIKPRKIAMMLRVAATLEDAFFGTPDPDDSETMWGLKYWLVKNAVAGFNGGLPAGFSTVANVNLTKVPTFKNYTDSYTEVSKADLIKKMRLAHERTHWKSPISAQEFRTETGQKRRILVNLATKSAMETVGESQNDNLGRDIASMDNNIVFRGHAIHWVPALDADTSDPVYMYDQATFKPLVLKGEYLRRSEAEKAPGQHNVFVSYIDLTIQTICYNRRANAVLAKF